MAARTLAARRRPSGFLTMRVLILGGTQFLGRHLTEAALEAGHEVTLFNRGRSNPDLFGDRVHTVRGDRDGGLQPLATLEFDACLDPSGYVPRLVGDSAKLLAERIGHYTFISSISVYPAFTPGMTEDSPLATLEDPATEDVDGSTYGGLKVLCEQAAEAHLPGQVLNVRSGLLIGPFDPTDRFTYWPVRLAAGGEFAAPVGPDLPVQIIDARDQARWIIHCMEHGHTGTFNVTGRETTFGDVRWGSAWTAASISCSGRERGRPAGSSRRSRRVPSSTAR